MPDPSSDERTVAEAAAVIVGRLAARLDEVTRVTQERVISEISELRGDAQLLQLLRDTVATNIDTYFSSIRHNIPIDQVEPPTPALEYARRLAQRDVSANALVRAYRLGHQLVLGVVLDEVRDSEVDPRLSLDVYELVSATSFDYIDWISRRVVATYQDERERWVENRNSIRASRVRELLSSDDTDIDALTTAIRYPLRRHHLAAVVWCAETERGDDITAMERFVAGLATAVGAHEAPLFIPVDDVTGWAWIPLPADATAGALSRLRDFAAGAAEAPWLAAGSPLPGIEGFRRSHQQAKDARAVATAAGAEPRRVIAAGDPGLAVAALFGANLGAAAALVAEALGPLAAATESDERLRDTLRVFLRNGASYTAAADELHLHHNSVKYRVGRAIERRGRPIDDDRLDVEIALLLCEWFGTAVLS